MTSLWGKGDTRILSRSDLLFCGSSATSSCVKVLCASCSSDPVFSTPSFLCLPELAEAGLVDSETMADKLFL